MALTRGYSYEMGFKVNGTAIPDPSVFTGAGSDLDTLGKRDSTGLLHRNRVATKYHTKLEWNGIDWEMIKTIGSKLGASQSFQFTYPEPLLGKVQTIKAYVGDREWECNFAPASGKWIGNLKVSVIQY